MFENEWLPQAITLGISFNDFWDMNPHIINIYSMAHKIEVKEKNAFMHLQGIYMRDAILSSICNAFKGKGQEPYEYPKEPYDLSANTELTEKEKDEQIELLFANLGSLKDKFDKHKGITD